MAIFKKTIKGDESEDGEEGTETRSTVNFRYFDPQENIVAEIDVWLPRKLQFLREPHRYKVLYGGRGGIKSWSIAQSLLIAGAKHDLRIPCARETMKSIKESVHQLLEDQITRLGLQGVLRGPKAEILGRRTQTSFTFRSMRDAGAFRTAAVMIREPEKKKETEKRRPGGRLSPWS